MGGAVQLFHFDLAKATLPSSTVRDHRKDNRTLSGSLNVALELHPTLAARCHLPLAGCHACPGVPSPGGQRLGMSARCLAPLPGVI